MRVAEIFKSISGEVSGSGQGTICTFIRLAGCNLQCIYCDTKWALNLADPDALDSICYRNMSIFQIKEKVIELGCPNIIITGGEPLLQLPELNDLINLLTIQGNFLISIETNGSIEIPLLEHIRCIIADWKLKNSGMEQHMDVNHLKNLIWDDYIKFVVNYKDSIPELIATMRMIREREIKGRFAVSPVFSNYDPNNLVLRSKLRYFAEELINDEYLAKEGVIFSLQIHKLLGLR